MKIEKHIKEFETLGDDHIGTSSETPMRMDAFELTNEEKIDIIKDDVRHIMETLGLDLTDDSLSGTPMRVAKMFVKEQFGGLNPNKKPSASTFQNKYKYGEMLVEKKHQCLFHLRTSFTSNSRKGSRSLCL
jgi:GTP cyclohydrolase I